MKLTNQKSPEKTTNRRTIIRGAAWSVPVVAVAMAAPAAAASPIDVGAYAINGRCGALGLLGPGFELAASPTAALPIGTTITITGSGVVDIGVFSFAGGVVSVSALSSNSLLITLTSPLEAGTVLQIRTLLAVTIVNSFEAVVTLPAGYIATGAKSVGTLESTATFCNRS